MTANGWLQFAVYFVALVVFMRPLGIYMTHVYNGDYKFLGFLERPIYRLSGVNQGEETGWKGYAASMLLFSFVSLVLTYIIERAQLHLPWNPQHIPGVEAFLAWNTAASFTTNTNWQAYTTDLTMSYFTQMVGLAYHNFLSAAVGISVAIALVRGIARRESKTIGNFWVDATRTCLYVLVPLCIISALVLVSQGVIQNLHPYTVAQTLEHQTQTIAQGPVASQEAIKMLGTNGGGFFVANSAHPFENPTPFSNFFQMFLIFLIGAALTVTLGRMTGSPGHGWAVFACMSLLFIAGFTVAYRACTA
jgi:potassium-transporting ATPase potassium-binding subunit